MSNKYYAIRKGKKVGIFNSWEDCKQYVNGFSGAEYKSFKTKQEALNYLKCIDEKPSVKSFDYDVPYCFVDGSFNKYTNTYGYGGIIVYNGNKYVLKGNGCEEELLSMRNVTGEILGTMKSIEKAIELGIKELIVYYDYLGIEKWVNGDWQTNKKLTYFYSQFMNEKQKYIKLNFVKVKSHSGVEGNELADKLAKESVGLL